MPETATIKGKRYHWQRLSSLPTKDFSTMRYKKEGTHYVKLAKFKDKAWRGGTVVYGIMHPVGEKRRKRR